MSGSNHCFLTCIQVSQEAGKVVWYSCLWKNFPQCVVIHTVKGFSIVSEAEEDVFLEFPCFFGDPEDVGNLISGSSAFLKCSLSIWKLAAQVLLRPALKGSEHHFAGVWASIWKLAAHALRSRLWRASIWKLVAPALFWASLCWHMGFLRGWAVENLPAMQEAWIQSLGWKDSLEKGMVTHSSILAWRVPWTEEPSRLQSMGLQRVEYDWATFTYTLNAPE